MSKFKLIIISLIALSFTTVAIISCSKDSSDSNTNGMLTNKENKLLKKKFGFTNFSTYKDETGNSNFKSSISIHNPLSRDTITSADVDLSKVTEVTWGNDKSFFVPLLNEVHKMVVVSIKDYHEGMEIKYENGTVIENLVDENGNGTLVITTPEGSTKLLFANGIRVTETLLWGRNFRHCFDLAYDAVCDDFIGCVAWYSNPGVPLAAAAYCQIHG